MGVCFLQMPQDFSNGVLFKDEGDDAEGAPTLAFQRVGEIDPSDELGPTFPEGGPLFWRELGFVLACGVMVFSEGLKSDVSLVSLEKFQDNTGKESRLLRSATFGR